MLTVVEKVIFLQEVDIFEFIQSDILAHIAAATSELEFPTETEIYNEGDISNSMYLVVSGTVLLHQSGQEVMKAGPKQVFGTWALFDNEVRVTSAKTIEDTVVLRLMKEDFNDLLADHVKISQGIFRSLVRRLRSLMKIVGR